jgi:hypothetical protein
MLRWILLTGDFKLHLLPILNSSANFVLLHLTLEIINHSGTETGSSPTNGICERAGKYWNGTRSRLWNMSEPLRNKMPEYGRGFYQGCLFDSSRRSISSPIGGFRYTRLIR